MYVRDKQTEQNRGPADQTYDPQEQTPLCQPLNSILCRLFLFYPSGDDQNIYHPIYLHKRALIYKKEINGLLYKHASSFCCPFSPLGRREQCAMRRCVLKPRLRGWRLPHLAKARMACAGLEQVQGVKPI
ncbi:hypothetical protein ATW55_14405 [Ferroacidibacillus organovorans]|uniref:Uncharacterized protein n=1 Tax=Ferroacidibacillus organovorans TaxID=1765683 RepID=A0A124IW29_9BACL|nr:hypothetical protein ATW55_14405 [Ferroacidibacillus organovorans]